MSLITDDWRLKLLAVGLAVLMLGAVAFSQNPPTTNSKTVGLTYQLAPNLVLIDPPATTTVTYTGLADVISHVTASNLTATVDAPTHAGAAVRLNVTAKSTLQGATPQNPAPIVVTVETLLVKELPVSVTPPRAAPGFSVNKVVPNPAVVHFSGPASWEANLTATATFPGTVSVTGPIDSPNQPLQLQNSNGLLDLTVIRTLPPASLDVAAVSIHIEATAGSSSSTVALVIGPPSHKPAAGYHITDVTITPNTVVISGDAGTIGKIRNIALPSLDLTGRTSDATFQVQIPYPAGTTGPVGINTATVKYSIAPDPAVSPSPTPT